MVPPPAPTAGGAAAGASNTSAEHPSILRGCFVRLVSKGAHRLESVSASVVDEHGQLALKLQVRGWALHKLGSVGRGRRVAHSRRRASPLF